MADRADWGDRENEDRENEDRENEETETTEHSAADEAADIEVTADQQAAETLGLDSLSMMHSDDALLSALGGSEPDVAGDDVDGRELSELLLAWRRDIDSEPMAELVDTDTAVAAINRAAAPQRKSHRTRSQKTFVPVAVAAAVLMIAFTGTGLAARSSEPGDPLWGLTQVLYTEHAQSVQAAFSARGDLDTADSALAHGRFRKAADALDAAAAAIRHVQPGDHQQQLQAKHRKLAGKLPEQAGSPETSQTRDKSSSAAASTTGSTTTSPQEPSSSSEPSRSDKTSEPTTSSQPEVPPSTSSETPTPSPSTNRTVTESGDSSEIIPKLNSSDSSAKPGNNAPPAS